jgi:hypothetical protein
MPSPQPSPNQASLQGQLADVPQPGPSVEIVIHEIEARPAPGTAPAPVAEFGEDGSITIR